MNPDKYKGKLTAYACPDSGIAYRLEMHYSNFSRYNVLTKETFFLPPHMPSLIVELLDALNPGTGVIDTNTCKNIRYTVGTMPAGYIADKALIRVSTTPVLSSRLEEFKPINQPYGWHDTPGTTLFSKSKLYAGGSGVFTHLEWLLAPDTLYYADILISFSNRWYTTWGGSFTTTNI
jgi:hypothetical protein